MLLFGQLRPDKGVIDLLEAAARVEGVKVRLVGEDRGALARARELIHDPRLADRVLIREGFVPMERVRDEFAAADVVALPYHRASASGVLMLAYGYGRPVVTYPTGGLPEYVVPGETGWVCSRADPAALADTLAEVRLCGRSVWRRRGAAGRRLAEEQYSWEAVATHTVALYSRITAARSTPRSRRPATRSKFPIFP